MVSPQAFPTVEQLTQLQIDAVERWHAESISHSFDGIQSLVCQNHEFNYRLWHEEDTARSPSVTDDEIAKVKRAIDKLNQARNDMIEKIDDEITSRLEAQEVEAIGQPINTETAGSAMDRLSIMALRLYHYREQADRQGIDGDQRSKVLERIALCEQQHADLSHSLQALIDDLFGGRKQHRTYRQMKMYNDPSLNPAIYNAKESS